MKRYERGVPDGTRNYFRQAAAIRTPPEAPLHLPLRFVEKQNTAMRPTEAQQAETPCCLSSRLLVHGVAECRLSFSLGFQLAFLTGQVRLCVCWVSLHHCTIGTACTSDALLFHHPLEGHLNLRRRSAAFGCRMPIFFVSASAPFLHVPLESTTKRCPVLTWVLIVHCFFHVLPECAAPHLRAHGWRYK